jgi:flagellar motor switch protein FliG
LQGGETSGIEGLKWMDAPTVADLIKNEHPQIIATILVHLEHDHASEILNHFTERLRNDVVLRIATLEGIQPAALRELNERCHAHPLRLGERQTHGDGRRAYGGRNSQLHWAQPMKPR